MATLDVIIIGSGQAGVPLATRLAAAGKRVLLAERAELGGTCVNTGCTPTKTMIASARAAHVARTAGRLGVHAGDVRVDLAAVVARKDAIVRQWRDGIANKLRQAGERLLVRHGHARFVGAREIEVAGERHRADVVVIDVGARPVVPPIPGLDAAPWLDNRRAMELVDLPEHLLVLGGGYIGCELAQMFRRFGARVTVIDTAAHVLAREDDEVSTAIEGVFRDEGIALELGAKVSRVDAGGGGAADGGVAVTLDGGKRLQGSHLLVAVGRRPNTDDLGCDAAGVELDRHGHVIADDHYRTTAEGVFAVGDVIEQPQFTHVAWDDHRILYDVVMGRAPRGRSGRHIPYTAFTDPQVAGVGMTEREARAAGVRHEVATMPFGWIARAIEVDEKAGVMKLLIDPDTERVLGAFLVGAEAGELIHELVALMQAGASVRAIVDAQAVHPTFAEGVQSLVMKLPRFALT
jgi:pyruvate/2-oxoglutarate dehydrogenase complex dihydrolipoamide dehydrogenase (E3) component